MNGLCAESAALARGVADGAYALRSEDPDGPDIVLCPPFTQLTNVHRLLAEGLVQVGAQDCHVGSFGAFTGDVSATMLADIGATHVILGHSERRLGHGETDVLIHNKARSAMEAGLVPIVCVGETQKERDSGQAITRISLQIERSLPDNFHGVVAYEPIWAIGTGASATVDDIHSISSALRTALHKRFGNAANTIRILYGGSVTPRDTPAIFSVPDVDGVLVGGASLKVDAFVSIAFAAAGRPRAQ